MTIELMAKQTLWDVTKSPWVTLTAGARLEVLSVTKMATGRTDGYPIELRLRSADGAELALEVSDGTDVVTVLDPFDG